jgi:hypothetical protein
MQILNSFPSLFPTWVSVLEENFKDKQKEKKTLCRDSRQIEIEYK